MSRKPVPPADEDGFLARWSRRKAEARREGADAEPPVSTEATAERESEPEPSRDPEAVRPPDLPDIDSLTAESDFKLFLKEGVPEKLKTQALRRLWRLKPSLANLDGLVDYGQDFTDKAMAVTGIKSAYRVGRGYLREPVEQPPTDAPDTASATSPDGERGAAGTGAQAAEKHDPPEDPPAEAEATASEERPPEPSGRSPGDEPRARPRPLPRRG
jgi:hypothetical protein